MSVRKEKDKRGGRTIVVDQKWPDGKRYRRQMPNQKVAERVDARITAATLTGTWRELREELEYGIKPVPTIAQYSEHYLETYCRIHNKLSSYNRKRNSFKQMNRHIGRLRLTEMNPRFRNELMLARIEDGVKGATVNRDLQTLHHLFEFACDEGTLKFNPMRRTRKIKEIREERPRVTEEQYEAIIVHLAFPVDHIVRFVWETGCRPSEALALKHENVDAERQFAVLNCRKAGDNALIALTSRALRAVETMPRFPGCPFVFWNPKTGTRYRQINLTFDRARRKAGLGWVQLKDFRRALGIYLAESGEPMHVVQRQLGHSTIRTTEAHYAHYSPEFAVNRARPVLEDRRRQNGGDGPQAEAPESRTSNSKSQVVDFATFRKRGSGGGGRIRTAE
jgi:integrase